MYEYLSMLHPRMGMSIEIFVTNVLDNPVVASSYEDVY